MKQNRKKKKEKSLYLCPFHTFTFLLLFKKSRCLSYHLPPTLSFLILIYSFFFNSLLIRSLLDQIKFCLFYFGSHIWMGWGLTPGSLLRGHSWQCLRRDYLWCWGLDLGWLYSKLCLIYCYLFGPLIKFYLPPSPIASATPNNKICIFLFYFLVQNALVYLP